MIARVATKPDTQAMIKALRAAGLTVEKDSLGAYRCRQNRKDGSRVLLFAALPGRNSYLIRMKPDLFQ